jgi:hypothetical protein
MRVAPAALSCLSAESLLRPAVDLRQQHYYRHRRRDRARSKAKLNQSGRILAARTTFVHFSSSTPRNDAASAEFVPMIFVASALNCSLTDEFATALRHFVSIDDRLRRQRAF